MGPEHLLLLHNLRHVEILLDLEERHRAVGAVRKARAERNRALRRSADRAGASLRRAAGALTGRPPATDRTPAQTCDPACATA